MSFTDLYRDNCLNHFKQINCDSSQLMEKMSALDLNRNGEADSEWRAMAVTAVGHPFTEHALNTFVQCVEHEAIAERDVYWEGLQTMDDKRRSAHYQLTLAAKRALVCPYCRVHHMSALNGYLSCECAFHVRTHLSVQQIVDRLLSLLEIHQNGCEDLFPCFTVFKANLIVCCNSCAFNQIVV